MVPERPRLRSLEVIPIEQEGAKFLLRDPAGDSPVVLGLSEFAAAVIGLLDGTRDLGDIQTEICRASGQIVPRDLLGGLVAQLDEALFLDSPRFREHRRRDEAEYLKAPDRPAAFAGLSYQAEPDELGRWIDGLLTAADLRVPGRADGRAPLRAVLAPHIDPRRGAVCYGSAYRALRDAAAERIVILGISHHGGRLPYAIATKGYATPFGTCPVDLDFVNALAEGLPFDPLSAQGLHRKEHSIEFQAVFLRHLLPGWERRRIVPILCCFPYPSPGLPEEYRPALEWRQAFAERLRSLCDERTLIVLGVDFAHVGRRFGDAPGEAARRRPAIGQDDRRMMEAIASGDAAAFQAHLDEDADARRVCGYPAILTLLEAFRGLEGTILDYDQAWEEETGSVVTFGAMEFREVAREREGTGAPQKSRGNTA